MQTEGLGDGCHIHPSCLTCPLEVCIFDEEEIPAAEDVNLLLKSLRSFPVRERNRRLARVATWLPPHGRIETIARGIGLAPTYVRDILKSMGVHTREERWAAARERQSRIVKRAPYVEPALRCDRLAMEFGLSSTRHVFEILKSAGIGSREEMRRSQAVRDSRIVARAGELQVAVRVTTLAREFKLHRSTIRRVLRCHGVEIAQSNLAPDVKERVSHRNQRIVERARELISANQHRNEEIARRVATEPVEAVAKDMDLPPGFVRKIAYEHGVPWGAIRYSCTVERKWAPPRGVCRALAAEFGLHRKYIAIILQRAGLEGPRY